MRRACFRSRNYPIFEHKRRQIRRRLRTDFERIRQVFLAIVEQPAAQWEALLDETCGTDLELRQQVATLLKAHTAGEGILDHIAGNVI